ncbi:uncharacterized protein LOC113272893 [Papaver somniferum]|uniref:uncharacterized protein LOC113272893 n=1 Tax=Papaver somniferum TaxID=3469 RepID=UPI000E7044E1|nr:uncharacterized protein LOC113272893 [Papaver somniferum]
MESLQANQHEGTRNAPTENLPTQGVIGRKIRSTIVPPLQDGRETSVSSTMSGARSDRSTPEFIGNNSWGRRSPPRTNSDNVNRLGGVRNQLQVGQSSNPRAAQANNPQVTQANNLRVTQVNNPRVTSIDLTLRESFQELEREYKRLQIALEKRKELEDAAIPHSKNEMSNRHTRRERDIPRRREEVRNEHRPNRSNARRVENARSDYQSGDHRNGSYHDRYIPDDDDYYLIEQDRKARPSHRRRDRRRHRDDHINDDHSKRSRRERDHR